MLRPDDIARLCRRKYPAFLRTVVTGEKFFPIDIRFGGCPGTHADSHRMTSLPRRATAPARAILLYACDYAPGHLRRAERHQHLVQYHVI